MQYQKWQNDLSSFPRQTIQYHGNPTPIQCPNHWSWRSWSWPVLSRPTALSRTPSRTNTPPQNVLFIIGDLKAKVGCQEIHRITGKFGLGVQNEAGQKLRRVLPREHTGHSKHSFPTTQATTQYMDITRWSIPKSDWILFLQPKMEKLYIVSNKKTWSWLWLRSWAPNCKTQA